MKKFFAILMTLALMLSLAVPAMAAETGSITIKDAVVGQTYTIYQILDLESYSNVGTDPDINGNLSGGNYAYKATTDWANFINGTDIKGEYVTVDAQGYVQWINEADPAIFAKLAQTYAKTNNIEAVGESTATNENIPVKFTGLNLGYYLVDTTLGTLCSLDTTNPNVVMKEKNSLPTIDKLVQEDSQTTDDDNGWGASNTAQIGDTVNFKTTVHAKKGAQKYIVHDQMSEGLTLEQSSIAVKVNDIPLNDTDYNVTFDVACTDKENAKATCDFHITFTQTYLDTIIADTDIVITYSAILNDNAVISESANTNDTKLDYSEKTGVSTEWDHTDTYTFRFDIIKTDSNKKLLNGAEFELYDAETGENKIALVKEADGAYRVATTVEKKAEGFTSAIIKAGKVTVKGLDANTTYWLEETKAPDGYNKLAGRVEVKIENANLTTNMTGDTWNDNDGGVQITNQSGTELPETGGMGTTIFYIVGGIMVVAAVVLLVTKKRMSAEG